LKRRRALLKVRQAFRLLTIPFAASLTACQPSDGERGVEAVPEPELATAVDIPVVEVTAVDYAFDAPDEVPAGWTTFRMRNIGNEPHFMLLNRLPEGTTLEDYGTEVGVTFDRVWHELRDGSIDVVEAGAMLGELLPEWYADVRQMGGPGIVAADATAETTVKLEPGTYVMECYIKTPAGEFHASLGMARQIVVTEESSSESEPEADLVVTVSEDGIDAPKVVPAGEHRIAVHFAEHPEFGLGNDVHLAHLEGEATHEDVAEWMDWMELDGLRSPAPARFVGGANEMPVGYTSYFSVDLEPGSYVWVTERPAAEGKVQALTVE
jgi:hypothetical protein